MSALIIPVSQSDISGLFLIAITVIWAVFVTFAWLYIGWRAMVAHERLAQSAETLARRNTQNLGT